MDDKNVLLLGRKGSLWLQVGKNYKIVETYLKDVKKVWKIFRQSGMPKTLMPNKDMCPFTNKCILDESETNIDHLLETLGGSHSRSMSCEQSY